MRPLIWPRPPSQKKWRNAKAALDCRKAALARTISFRDSMDINAKNRKTLVAIFTRPTLASLLFTDIEALIRALGGEVTEREGSRVKVELNGETWRCHRPHPGKEAKRYQVEEARELLVRAGVTP